MVVRMISPESVVYVAGHCGLVGSAITRRLRAAGFRNLVLRSRKELDLTDRRSVDHFFNETKPQYVILSAAKVGGIRANISAPVDFLVENLRIQDSVLSACARHNVVRTLFLGSSCIYPRLAPQPMREEYLMTGPLEPTNESYALAKLAGLRLAVALRLQYGSDIICPIPSNVYGPGDHFDFERAHVLSSLVRRFAEAREANAPVVRLWGTGKAKREFLHVDDLADACLFLLGHDSPPTPVNVGTGVDCCIGELADHIRTAVGFAGDVEWDLSKPDGMPRKLLDLELMHSLGWNHQIDLEQGVRDMVRYYSEWRRQRPA